MKKIRTKSQIGKASRAAGKLFEIKIRHYLEEREFIVTKWENQIDFEKNKIIPAKHLFNPFTRSVSIGHGFPDYEARQTYGGKWIIIGVESKMSKYLDQKEKDAMDWYIKNHTFDHIIIAYKDDKGHITFKNYITGDEDFSEIHEAIGL